MTISRGRIVEIEKDTSENINGDYQDDVQGYLEMSLIIMSARVPQPRLGI